ncbi:hypothetical protein GX48_00009 [Paracoccidioides brasiliensis]|nr:hypothetical protein GX48_00009 [Paracoccidioides brasiliensis]
MSQSSSTVGELEIQAQKAENDMSAAETQSSALDAAISAVESYLGALKLASSPSERQRLDAKCKELLGMAEDIKRSKSWCQDPSRDNNGSSASASASKRKSSNVKPNLREPVSQRQLSKREQIILLEDSKLNGFVFPPWQSVPDPREFELDESGQLFTDQCDLRLSNLQLQHYNGWKRASERSAARVPLDRRRSPNQPLEDAKSIDLVQDVTTDCSVVASLCAVISQVERGYSKVWLTLSRPSIFTVRIIEVCVDKRGPQVYAIKFYPSEKETLRPKPSKSGKYIFRMHFNGCYRKVVVDNRLPSSKTSRFLHVTDRNDPELLWPALVEKAYLKLRGGYDFPGSNSGTDLWILTGWIPEQIFLHEADMIPGQLWTRLFNAFSYGDVLITAGTGAFTELEEKELGIIGMHDYAILDMKENNGRRQFLVKNPWAAGTVWEGIGQSEPPAAGECDNNNSSSNNNNNNNNNNDGRQRRNYPMSPGTFWTDCDKLLQNFECLYLNWNPVLFSFRQDIYFTWDLYAGRSGPGCFERNPQLSVSSKSGGSVWLLLSRHFATDDYLLFRHQFGDISKGKVEHGFTSLWVFNNDGQKVSLSEGVLHRAPFVDSPNTLMKFEMPPNTTYTVVVAEQSLRRATRNFSLSGFSTGSLTISRASDKYIYVQSLETAWTKSTAGGNLESGRYPTNPQFKIETIDTCDIAVLLETRDPELATHVKVVWSGGKRVSTVKSRDVAFASGDYRRGSSLAEYVRLPKGSYTAVCSTFAPDQVGKFTLWVKSTKECAVSLLPPEGAGCLSALSNVGEFPPGTERILAPITSSRLTKAKAIARFKGSWIGSRIVAPSPILMSIELGQGPYKKVFEFSNDGHFSDAASGVRIEEFDMQPLFNQLGGLWLVVERVGGPEGEVYDTLQVEILSEDRVEIGAWGVGGG